MRKKLKFGKILVMENRWIWIKRVAILLMLCFLVMAYKVWTPRLFPVAPVFYSLPTLPDWLVYAIYGFLIIAMLAALFLKHTKTILLSFCAVVILAMAYDYNRIQPYYLQLLVIFTGLALTEGVSYEEGNNSIKGIRLYFCFMYFFSGFFKFNPSFVEYVHPWFIQPFTVPLGIQHVPAISAWLIGFIEVITGIGLFFPKTRNIAVILAVFTHSFILACLGPFGHSWNYITWPWNIGMSLLTFFLFWNQGGLAWGTWTKNTVTAFKSLIFVVAGILPWLFLFGKWDSFLSFDLYSGKTKQAVIYLKSEELDLLPMEIRPYVLSHPSYTQRKYIDLTYWGLGEMNTLPYPEYRSFHKMHRSFSKQFYGKESVGSLVVFSTYTMWEEKQLRK